MRNSSHRMLPRAFFAILFVAGAALLFLAFTASRREPATLKQQTETSASNLARLIVGSVEHAMLQGEGIAVQNLVDRLKARVPEADIAIYDPRGIEVFGTKPPAPARQALPPGVRDTLDQATRRIADGAIYRPIVSEQRCNTCHDDGERLRGVLAVELASHACNSDIRTPLDKLVTEGFIHVMTARREDLLDDYFTELVNTAQAVQTVAVFDASGERSYGTEIPGLQPHSIRDALAANAPTRIEHDGASIELITLPMQARCVACHDGAEGSVRGLLAISFAAPDAAPGDDATATTHPCRTDDLETTIETSLRFIMMSKLGRRIADFLDAAVQSGPVRKLVLYDNAGRVYWTTDHPEPPEFVGQVLRDRRPRGHLIGEGEDERVEVVEPLVNEAGCVQCHGADSRVRGAVSVSLTTAAAAKQRMQTLKRRASFTTYVVLGALLILLAVLYFFRPRAV